MLDKLILTSPRLLSLESVCTRLKGRCREYSRGADNFYGQVSSFKSEGGEHLLSICTEPRKTSSHPLRIITNPSRFSSLSEMDEVISCLEVEKDLFIRRLDYRVDVEFPVQVLWETLFVPRKKVRIEYRERSMTGFYIGRYPEVVCIYSNRKLGRDWLPECRVELRQNEEKLPVKRYSELVTLSTLRPFKDLSFKRLKADLSPESSKEERKVQRLQESIQKLGASGAFKALNIYSNFKRDYEGLLEPYPGLQNLDDIFQQNLNSYFGEAINGDRAAN